jgi:hypothetical protein
MPQCAGSRKGEETMSQKHREDETKERARIAGLYRQLVHSIREARSLQSVMEKEQQMRRIMHYLRKRQQTA